MKYQSGNTMLLVGLFTKLCYGEARQLQAFKPLYLLGERAFATDRPEDVSLVRWRGLAEHVFRCTTDQLRLMICLHSHPTLRRLDVGFIHLCV